MKSKYLLFLIIILCMSQIVYSLDNKHITTLDMCENNALVKVRPNEDLIEIKNCYFETDGLWYCKCKKDLSIDLIINHNNTKEYDVVVQYYLNKNLENSMRKVEINNIKVNIKEPPKKEKLKMPEFKGGSWIIILIFIILLFIGLLILGIRSFFKDYNSNDEDVEYINKLLDEIDK